MARYLYVILFFLLLGNSSVFASGEDFSHFPQLPLVLQTRILSDVAPTQALSLNKDLRRKMQEVHIWAKPNAALLHFVNLAFDKYGYVVDDSQLMREAKSRLGSLLIRRLLFFSIAMEDVSIKQKVKRFLISQVAGDPFSYTDNMIEFNRTCKTLHGVFIPIGRAELAHGSPMIHSALLPKAYRPYFHSAILELTQTEDDGIYRVWRFTDHPDQAMLATVSLKHDEEYPLFNAFMDQGHLILEDKLVLYKDKQSKLWPVAE
ncbi:MAG: hypothetical protein KBB83_05035 [Alphaproteobacteria bacterium]|nr:hypothetical protein [Alphaproteobacteria bacterium]